MKNMQKLLLTIFAFCFIAFSAYSQITTSGINGTAPPAEAEPSHRATMISPFGFVPSSSWRKHLLETIPFALLFSKEPVHDLREHGAIDNYSHRHHVLPLVDRISPNPDPRLSWPKLQVVSDRFRVYHWQVCWRFQ